MATRRNYLNIIEDGRTRIEQNTPITNFNSTGTTKAFLDILGIEGDRVYDTLEYIYKAIDPTKANGSDLDNIGYLVGENRLDSLTPVDYSTTNFYFYIDPRLNMSLAPMIKRSYTYEERMTLVSKNFLINDQNGEPIGLVIPRDTVVQTFDGSISYTTINDIIVANTESYGGIIATSSGPNSNIQSNSLVAHTLAQIPELRKISQYIKCSNRFPIQNGKYSESDDEFRYKIATAKSTIKGNELAIRKAAKSVPGVRDILYEKNKYGNGTFSIIVDGISPLTSQGLIDAVKEKVQQELSYGDVVFVDRPEYLGVELDFGIVTEIGVTDELSIRQEAKNNVIQYINDLPIGGEIVWNKIIDVVMDVNGVMDIIPKSFKFGTYDIFNKINKNVIVLRFQNQKANMLQKFYTDHGMIGCCAI